MTTQEHLLTLVMEECAETAQRASKAIRFGIDDVQSGQPDTNRKRLMIEYSDLVAVVEMMTECGYLEGVSVEELEAHIVAKKVKIKEQMEISRKLGTLEPENQMSDRTWNCYNNNCRLKCQDCPDKGLSAEEVAAKHSLEKKDDGMKSYPFTAQFIPGQIVKMEAKVGVEVKESSEFSADASRGQWNPDDTSYQDLVNHLRLLVKNGRVNPRYISEIETLAETMQVHHEKKISVLLREIESLKMKQEDINKLKVAWDGDMRFWHSRDSLCKDAIRTVIDYLDRGDNVIVGSWYHKELKKALDKSLSIRRQQYPLTHEESRPPSNN